MNEIRLPLPAIDENSQISIVISTSSSSDTQVKYRLEEFSCNTLAKSNPADLQKWLKNKIVNYDKNWEVIQIFANEIKMSKIQVLFRELK